MWFAAIYTVMTLKGWTKKLPEYIVKAIKNGTIIVCQAKDYEYLKGEIVNPEGTKISFL